jgi:hypothetical protein
MVSASKRMSIVSGQGFYTANNNTWTLSAGQMFLILPGKPVVYCADSRAPWSYAWIGFKGNRVESILSECGFTRNRLGQGGRPECRLPRRTGFFESIQEKI